MKPLLTFCLITFFSVGLFAQIWHSKFDFNTHTEDNGSMGTVGNVGIGFYSWELNHPAPNINHQPETPYLPQKPLHIIGYEDAENPEFIAPRPTIRLDHRTIHSGTGTNTGSGNSENRMGGPSLGNYSEEFTCQQHVWDIENNKGVLGFYKDGSRKIVYSDNSMNFGMPSANGAYDLNIYGTVNIGLSLNSSPNDLIVNGQSTFKGVFQSENEAFFENKVIIGDPSIIHSSQSDPNNKLIVQGTGVFQEVLVDYVAEWNDKVFDKNYELRSLKQLEDFIKKNHHLPEIPAEKEIKNNGYNLTEMDALLAKNFETLKLCIIHTNRKTYESSRQFV